MKKHTLVLTLFALLATPLAAQEVPAPATEVTATPATEEDTDVETGSAAAAATRTAKSNALQNWIFAAGAIVAAVIGIVIVSFSEGAPAHS